MLFDLIDLSKLRRAILYALLLAALFLVQDMILSHIALFGVRALIIPAAVVAVGLFDGGLWGGFVGLAAGLLSDIGSADTVVMFTVLYALLGFLTGAMGQFLFRKGFLSFLVLCAAALAVVTFCQMFRFLFFTDTNAAAVWRTGILQLLWSLPWSVPVYFPCKSIADHNPL